MFRKLGYAALAVFGLVALTQEIYHVSAIPGINGWIVEQQRIVQEQGDKAPLEARAAAAFSRLPHDLLNMGAQAQTQPGTVVNRPILRDHVSVTRGSSPPTVTGATITSGSTDYRGRLTAPTAQTVTVTFGTVYLGAPWCDVTRSDGESTSAKAWTVSTTALTITNVTTGATIVMNWRCDGVTQ